ncbi:MAG: hypothetical protein R3E01_10400 [Pirellulaceae bacterium]
MENTLRNVLVALEAEETKLKERITELRAGLAKEEDNLKRVRGALRELAGKPGRKTTATTNGGPKQRAPNRNAVVAMIKELLKEHGVLEEQELRQLVEAEAKRAGYNRMGLALRIGEALAGETFVDSPGGYRLAAKPEEALEAT